MTQVCHPQVYEFPTLCFNPTEQAKEHHQQKLFAPFHGVSHSVLKVNEISGSLQPANTPLFVTVFNASDGTKVTLRLISTDTIGKLKQEYLKMRPDMIGSLNLAFNGKPCVSTKTMQELRVKPEATFVTFSKCHGG